jgi:peptidyl-prolyl cis-trans isomerase D
MITIGKIREKSGLLILVIGGALLVIILGEAFRSFGGGGSVAPPQGEVYGAPLDDAEINRLTELYTANLRQSAMQQGREFSEQDQKQAEDGAFNEVLRLRLLNKEFDALGVATNDAEIDAFINGTDDAPRSQTMLNYFPSETAPDGFDNESFQGFMDQVNQGVERAKEFYETGLRTQIKNEREADKYVTLLQHGNYITKAEIEADFRAENEVYNISYVLRNFDFTDVELSDEQFEAFYKEFVNHPKYKQKDTREYVYSVVDVKPSTEDFDIAKNVLAPLKEGFASAESDSIFVYTHSDQKSFNRAIAYGIAMQEGQPNTYPESIDKEIQAASIGQVVGPYVNGANVQIAKIIGFQSEKQAWVRHILLSAGDEASFGAAETRADSIMQVIREKNNFGEMVTKFSEDPGSVNNGGEYKWFPEGQMVETFNDYSFNAPIKTLGRVKTNYGIHIIEVLDRRAARKPNLALVSKTVQPSDLTIDMADGDARDLWSTLEEKGNRPFFDSLASEMGYSVQEGRAFLENPTMQGFGPSAQSQALNFLFGRNNEELSISDPIRDGNRFLLVQLTKVVKEGAPDKDVAKQVMEAEAKKKYLGESYAKEMKGVDLKALAEKFNTVVEEAQVTFKQGTIGASGAENTIIGALFSVLKSGKKLPALTGGRGVYAIRLDKIVFDADAEIDYDAKRTAMFETFKTSVSSRAFQALMKYADYKDNRSKLRVGAY